MVLFFYVSIALNSFTGLLLFPCSGVPVCQYPAKGQLLQIIRFYIKHSIL